MCLESGDSSGTFIIIDRFAGSYHSSKYVRMPLCRVQTVLKLLMTGRDHPRGGIMIPIPQYPLYTATIAEFNAYAVS